jgi:hypothetical protein
MSSLLPFNGGIKFTFKSKMTLSDAGETPVSGSAIYETDDTIEGINE